MFSNLEIVVLSSTIGVFCLILGLMFGYMWGELSTEKRAEAREKEEEQHRMWKEYLSSIGGKK